MNYSDIPVIFKDLDKNNQFLTYLISIKNDQHFKHFLKVFKSGFLFNKTFALSHYVFPTSNKDIGSRFFYSEVCRFVLDKNYSSYSQDYDENDPYFSCHLTNDSNKEFQCNGFHFDFEPEKDKILLSFGFFIKIKEIFTELNSKSINNDFFNIFLTKKEFSYLLNFIDYHDLNSFENIKQIEQLNSLKNEIDKKDRCYRFYKNLADNKDAIKELENQSIKLLFFTVGATITAVILILHHLLS